MNANYTIVISDYLANGGDHFNAFKKIVKKNEILGKYSKNKIMKIIK